MADKKTIDKVKELLDSNACAPLKEAAEKWLAAAEEKYGDKFEELKKKSSEAFEKLGDMAEDYAEKSIETNEKLGEARDKVTAEYEKLAEKAGPAIEEFKEKAAPVVADLMEKAAPTIEKISDNEFVAKLKEGISTFSDNIAFFSTDEAKDKFGAEAADQIRKHAEEMKAQGKTYCDCPACTKAREILRDLGVELEEPEA